LERGRSYCNCSLGRGREGKGRRLICSLGRGKGYTVVQEEEEATVTAV
jgi:hypothetical protein